MVEFADIDSPSLQAQQWKILADNIARQINLILGTCSQALNLFNELLAAIYRR